MVDGIPMILAELTVRNFRNHAHSVLEFGDGITVLFGDNGQGKTNLLEAISYVSLTKSFFGASDATVLRIGAEQFEVLGTVIDGSGRRRVIRVAYTNTTGEKVYTVNGVQPERLASVIGEFPVVVLSPDHTRITSGGPGERRKFIDLLLSQMSRAYFEELLEFRRILRQRNRLLGEGRTMRMEDVQRALEPWTTGLVQHGGAIMAKRRAFLDEFQGYVRMAYERLVPSGEQPEITYVPSGGGEEAVSARLCAERLSQQLQHRQAEELRRGVTLVGPHRDEVRLVLSGKSVQEYASQGQHKTMLIALKLAEFLYVRERRGEAPLVLLDDVFSELDTQRAHRVLELVPELGQTMLTTTNEQQIGGSIAWNARHRRYVVERGACRYA